MLLCQVRWKRETRPSRLATGVVLLEPLHLLGRHGHAALLHAHHTVRLRLRLRLRYRLLSSRHPLLLLRHVHMRVLHCGETTYMISTVFGRQYPHMQQ